MIGNSTAFARRLLHWYQQHRRDLPWRLPTGDVTGQLDPYHVLVSEAMLQQTQVTTVIPYFKRFLLQFATVQSLAEAETQTVLRAWQGLGYYSRARNLQLAAKQIVAAFDGKVPGTVDELLLLPGIGRYTAGAVASIGFEKRAPILDGNVARVLCRLDAIREDPRTVTTRELLWARAEQVLPRAKVGDFNSALMELGALICAPRSPQCLLCPVRVNCQANAEGLQEIIPPPRKAKATPLFERWVFCIRHEEQYRIEQRPAKGRWAGMWQFATIEARGKAPDSALLQNHFSLRTTAPISIGSVAHALTHRRYHFEVFSCKNVGDRTGEWATAAEMQQKPMPRPHLKIRDMIEAAGIIIRN